MNIRVKTLRHPFFISPHAVRRFQAHVANIPAPEVILAIQERIQNPGEPVQWQIINGTLAPVFQAKYPNGTKTRTYYIPVVPGEGEWPAVPTIISSNSPLHKKWCAGRLEPIYKEGLDD